MPETREPLPTMQEVLRIAALNLQRFEIPPEKIGFFQSQCEHPSTAEVRTDAPGVRPTTIVCLICGNDLFPF